MAWPTYDKKQHDEQGDDYLAWLRSWNVDPDQAMAESKLNVVAQADAGSTPVSPAPSPVEQQDSEGASASPVAESDADDDYDDWTNEELREELDKRELSKSGNKAELMARLREDDEAE